jgi:hypothetical protein
MNLSLDALRVVQLDLVYAKEQVLAERKNGERYKNKIFALKEEESNMIKCYDKEVSELKM